MTVYDFYTALSALRFRFFFKVNPSAKLLCDVVLFRVSTTACCVALRLAVSQWRRLFGRCDNGIGWLWQKENASH